MYIPRYVNTPDAKTLLPFIVPFIHMSVLLHIIIACLMSMLMSNAYVHLLCPDVLCLYRASRVIRRPHLLS